ncbi:MAG: SDR family NAD(P)-dependent oxidoreductase [Beijerinckiaceae bacterium]
MKLDRIVIVGATSLMAEHCARLWVADKPADVTLVGRDATRVENVAADLRARSALSTVRVVTGDFTSAGGIKAIVESIVADGAVDTVLIAHGILLDQSACEHDLLQADQQLQVNAISPVLFAEAFAQNMARVNYGRIGIIGSVAGDRGRKSNYIYGAAKGLVSRYAEGMQHRFAKSGVRVTIIKPGPTDTPMTAELKAKGARMASPEDVAKAIVSGMAKGKPVIYAPGIWRIIMLVIRHIPGFVFNRLNI